MKTIIEENSDPTSARENSDIRKKKYITLHQSLSRSLIPQCFDVVCPISSPSKIWQIELNLIPTLVQSHRHCANKWFYSRGWLSYWRERQKVNSNRSKKNGSKTNIASWPCYQDRWNIQEILPIKSYSFCFIIDYGTGRRLSYLIIRCSKSSPHIFVVKNHYLEREVFSQLKSRK